MSNDNKQQKASKAERRAERAAWKRFQEKFYLWAFFIILLGGMLFVVLKMAPSAIQNGSTNNPATEPVSFDLSGEEWTKGPADAPVTVVEYSDFQCPGCKAAEPGVVALLEQYPDDVRFVYRHFPLQMHANAFNAAAAAEAAGIQGKFWQMHDQLFDTQSEWENDSRNQFEVRLRTYASQLGLNVSKFETDLHSDEVTAAVQADLNSATELRLPGTPTFFVNGVQLGSFADLPNAISAAVFSANQVEVTPEVDTTDTTTQ